MKRFLESAKLMQESGPGQTDGLTTSASKRGKMVKCTNTALINRQIERWKMDDTLLLSCT